MDSYLSIAGLALAIAALVPILFPATRVRFWTVTAGALSLMVLIGSYQAYKEVSEIRAIKKSKEEIWTLLTKNEKGMTFDQIYDNMYYPNFEVTNLAVDELIAERQIQSEKVEALGPNGAKFSVRRFYRHFE
ncbi:hypothetical protein [Limnohabitans sp. T6-20]|uniref:hypothetical protein n=1 Tax=Limnohabitans sp. T6-20 TaxID=1100725 RepID=UPI000D33C5C8|nr:hypothetical protein [Limnohabitans sp. T6-20]PUE12662.1 hypothetical protein B9Z33_03900 [Limnohabitans sp. T6-20]